MRHRTYILAAIFAAAVFSGCGKWLDVQPYDEIAEEDLMSTPDGFRQLLNGIYIDLNDDMLYGGALSVEMIEIMGGAYEMGTDGSVWGDYSDLASYKYNTEYWRTRFNETWNKAYELILDCNLLLAGIDSRKGIFTGDDYYIIKGEALALRAMLHFDMLRIFGPVYSRNPDASAIPYYKEYDGTAHAVQPASEVAALILEDLNEARVLLSVDPVRTEGTGMDGPSGGSSDNFLYYRNLRLNYFAVCALLARVYLWTGDRQEALKYAQEVIQAGDDGIFPFVDRSLVTGSPDDPDRIFSSEVIFALSDSQRETIFDSYFDPSRLPNYVFTMDDGLFSDCIFGGVSTGGSLYDYRYLANWRTTGGNSYFYKYSDMANTGDIRNTMVPLIRLGEMYLIAAESQSADISGGLSYINRLRSNRGVTQLSGLTQDLLQYEYIRELYGEGQLFFMYKRMFTRVLASSSASENPEAGDAIFVVPLPQSETEN